MFRVFYVPSCYMFPRALSSQGTMFPRPYVPWALCFPGPYVPGPYVHRALSPQGTMFPRDLCFPMFYVPSCPMFLCSMFPRVPISQGAVSPVSNVPLILCSPCHMFPRDLYSIVSYVPCVLCSLVSYIPPCSMFPRVLCSIVCYVPSCAMFPRVLYSTQYLAIYGYLTISGFGIAIFRRKA